MRLLGRIRDPRVIPQRVFERQWSFRCFEARACVSTSLKFRSCRSCRTSRVTVTVERKRKRHRIVKDAIVFGEFYFLFIRCPYPHVDELQAPDLLLGTSLVEGNGKLRIR